MSEVRNKNHQLEELRSRIDFAFKAEDALSAELHRETNAQKTQKKAQVSKTDFLQRVPEKPSLGASVSLPKRHLDAPQQKWESILNEMTADDGENIVAIMGQAMMLVLKSTSNLWSTFWKQASQSMNYSIEMAPVIADAVKTNWDNQARATKEEANIAQNSGIASISSGVLVFGMGCKFAGDAAAKEAENADATLTEAESQATAPKLTKEANDNITDAEKNAKTPVARLKTIASSLKSGYEKMNNGFGKMLEGVQRGQVFLQMSNGMTQLLVESPGKTKIAIAQRASGSANALEKLAETQQQVFGSQDFQRTEDLRNNTQQNFQYAIDIVKSSWDSMTSVVVSMFRG